MTRLLPVWLMWAAALTAAAPGLLLAAEPKQQDGLPPELVIADKPAPDKQLQTLRALLQTVQASKPAGGGLLGGLKGLLSGGGKTMPVAPSDLLTTPDTFRGHLVSISGLYQALGKDRGQFRCEEGKCAVTVPTGILIEGLTADRLDGMPLTIEGMAESGGLVGQLRATKISPCPWLAELRIARLLERLGQYTGPDGAEQVYEKASQHALGAGSLFAAFAKVSAARLAFDELRDRKKAKALYSAAWNPFTPVDRRGKPKFHVWVPRADGSGWDKLSVVDAISKPLDALASTGPFYRVMDIFVIVSGGQRWLGILLLAILSRVIIWPLTKKQLSSAEAMKRLQPQIKALQDRHVDDKQKFQEEFWKLCQANGVNPLGGCLPMIVQMPILIVLWQGIRDYIVQFNGHGFLWVKNLAAPDTALLVAYTVSMIFFQKMTQKLQPNPTMTAQQQQQQSMMTYMMPLMFFMMFKTFPAAFLLYWLGTNVVYFAQQYLYTRSQAKHSAAEGTQSLVPDEKRKGGFAEGMVKMLSARGGESPQAEAETKKSLAEREAEAKGKKAAKPEGKATGKRGGR
jgi:YidC/Oxa1 family membrane protein insertase